MSIENLVIRRVLMEIHSKQEEVLKQCLETQKKVAGFMEAQEFEVVSSGDEEESSSDDGSYTDTSASSVPTSPQSAPW